MPEIGFNTRPELVVGSIRGVRTWTLDSHNRLRGVSFPRIFKPGLNVAQCQSGYDHKSSSERPSMARCSCGYYAYFSDKYREHDSYSDSPKNEVRVVGVMEGTGEAIVGTRGFRASNARLIALALPNESRFKVLVSQWLPDRSLGSRRKSYSALDKPLNPIYTGTVLSVLLTFALSAFAVVSLAFLIASAATLSYLDALWTVGVVAGVYHFIHQVTRNSQFREAYLRQRKRRTLVKTLKLLYPDATIYDSVQMMVKSESVTHSTEYFPVRPPYEDMDLSPTSSFWNET